MFPSDLFPSLFSILEENWRPFSKFLSFDEFFCETFLTQKKTKTNFQKLLENAFQTPNFGCLIITKVLTSIGIAQIKSRRMLEEKLQ